MSAAWSPRRSGSGQVAVPERVRSRHSVRSFFIGSTPGQIIFLIVVAGILNVAGTLTWRHVGSGTEFPPDWDTSIWFAWGLFFDPGTQTGLLGSDPPRAKAAAALFSVFGFIFNLVMLGVIVDAIREFLLRHEEMHSKVIANDHLLILNWTDKTLFLLGELLASLLTEGQKKKQTIVILGNMEKSQMMREIKITFPSLPSRVKIICREGRPYEVDDLARVSAASASTIFVLGASRNPRAADCSTVTSVLALGVVPGLDDRATRIIAEVRLPESVEVVERLAENAQALVSRDVVDRVLAISMLQPSLGRVYADLMSCIDEGVIAEALDAIEEDQEQPSRTWARPNFDAPSGKFSGFGLKGKSKDAGGGSEIYTTPCPQALVGYRFGDVATFFPRAVLFGVAHARQGGTRCGASRRKPHLAPCHTYVFEADDFLLFIAENRRECAPVFDKSSSFTRFGRSKTSVGGEDEFPGDETSMGGEDEFHRIGATSPGHRPPRETTEVTNVCAEGGAKLIAVLGWKGGATAMLLATMDEYCVPGTVVMLLNDTPVKRRERNLKEEGIDVDGQGLRNIAQLLHVVGPHTSKRILKRALIDRCLCPEDRQLPLQAVVVLGHPGRGSETDQVENEDGDGGGGGADEDSDEFAQMADASTLAVTILLDKLIDEAGLERPTVVCEFLDNVTQRILKIHPHLATMAGIVPFHRNVLEVAYIALMLQDPLVQLVFEGLLHPDGGGHLAAVRPETYIGTMDREAFEAGTLSLNFIQWSGFVRKAGHVLVGFSPAGAAMPMLNPPDKRVPLELKEGDELLVLIGTGDASVWGRAAALPALDPPPPVEEPRDPFPPPPLELKAGGCSLPGVVASAPAHLPGEAAA